jgi:hypothetical protein
MTIKRLGLSLLFLSIGLAMYGYHYVGSVLAQGIGNSLSAAHVPYTESRDLSAKLALPGALIFLALGLWLLLSPYLRKLISSIKGRDHG